MEIYAVILFVIGIILALYLLPLVWKDYSDEQWINRMSQRLMPEIREEVDIKVEVEKQQERAKNRHAEVERRMNIGNSLRTKE